MQYSYIKTLVLSFALLNAFSLSAQQLGCEDPNCLTDAIDLSTGIDHLNGNAHFAIGDQDPYWQITNSPSGPLGASTVINPDPNWMPGFGNGQWVSIDPGSNPSPDAPYTFERCFCNCASDFWIDELVIFGSEQISAVRLNGTTVYSNTSNVYDPNDSQNGIHLPRWAFGGAGTFCLEVDIRKLKEDDEPIGLLVSAELMGFDLLRPECCNEPPPPPATCDMVNDDCRVDLIDLTSGLNPNGTFINNNGTFTDPSWQIIQEPNGNLDTPYNPLVINEVNGWNGWNFPVNSPAPGQWLSPTANGGDSPGNAGLPGVYTYERCFCTCEEGNVAFDFTVFGDNFINNVRVGNNNLYTIPTGVGNAVHFQMGVRIATTINLPAGRHCIQADVSNIGGQTGFKLEGDVRGGTLLADGCCEIPPPADCCEAPGETTIFHEDFDPGSTGSNSTYTLSSGSLNPGEYDFINSAQATTLSSGTWDVVGHTGCDPAEQFMAINGQTGGAGMAMVYETPNLPITAEEQAYDFCIQLKHLPQCVFDVVPNVQVQVVEFLGGGGSNILFTSPLTTVAAGLANCDYQNLTGTFTSNAAVPNSTYRLQLFLDESGIGDGNDLAIDDVVINFRPTTNNFVTRFVANTTPVTGTNNIAITVNADQPLPDDCTSFWEVWEVTDPANPLTTQVMGTYSSGDAIGGWGDSHDFPGYCCIPTPAGAAGVFDEALFYYIRRTVECDCEEPNVWGAIINNQHGLVEEEGNSTSLIHTGDKLHIHPNPFNSSFTLRLPMVLEEATTARISALNGAVVKELQLQPGERETTVDLANLPAGMYILQTHLNGEFYSTKLIKQ